MYVCVCLCKLGREDKNKMDAGMYIGKIVGGGVVSDADPLDLPKEWSACPHSLSLSSSIGHSPRAFIPRNS